MASTGDSYPQSGAAQVIWINGFDWLALARNQFNEIPATSETWQWEARPLPLSRLCTRPLAILSEENLRMLASGRVRGTVPVRPHLGRALCLNLQHKASNERCTVLTPHNNMNRYPPLG